MFFFFVPLGAIVRLGLKVEGAGRVTGVQWRNGATDGLHGFLWNDGMAKLDSTKSQQVTKGSRVKKHLFPQIVIKLFKTLKKV